MVKRLLVFILLILTCFFCLTTCDLFVAIFSMSPFPSYLAQAVASVDMRGDIETFLGNDYSDWESDVYVLRNSVRERVFLVVRRNPGPQMVYVFDTKLNLEVSHRVDNHRRIGLVEAENLPDRDNFVVGGGRFNYSDLSPMNPPEDPYPPISEDTWQKYTFAHGGSNYIAWNEGNQLTCAEYDSGWTLLNSAYYTPIKMDDDVRLAGLGYEPDLGEVYLFIFGRDWDRDEGYLYIIRTAAGDYPSPLFTYDLVTDGLSDGRTSSRVRDVEDRRPALYTRKGVVVEARNRGTFRLVSVEGDVIKSFYITSDERTPFDFDIDGKYYYVFNRTTLRLYKAETGF
jgi:hypothetical protein